MDAKLATLLLSVAIHAAVVALFAPAEDEERARVSVATERGTQEDASTVVVEEPVPVEIALVDPADFPTAAAIGTTRTASTPRVRSSTRGERPATPGESAGPSAPAGPSTPKGTFKMRSGPEPESLASKLAGAVIAQGHMEVVVPDLPGARIDYEISTVEAQLRDARWVANASPDAVRGARELLQILRAQRKQVELVAQKDGTYRTNKDTFTAHVGRDGKVRFDDKSNLRVEGLSGRFDTTDWLMRRYGMDPYASAKLAFLDRTRDQRAEIAKVDRRERLGQSVGLMQRNLERVWATSAEVDARKRAVFELWDECEEQGDEDVKEATEQARGMLVRWVQTKLRGADAFTEEELARLNARRTSKAVFAP